MRDALSDGRDAPAAVVAEVDDAGQVLWAKAVEGALQDAPPGVAAAEDGSFALYGTAYLGRFTADGTTLWTRTDADVSGASFTADALVVAATVSGGSIFNAPIGPDDGKLRAALAAFPR